MNGAGSVRSAYIVKVGGFLKMKLEDRFGEKIGSEDSPFLTEGKSWII